MLGTAVRVGTILLVIVASVASQTNPQNTASNGQSISDDSVDCLHKRILLTCEIFTNETNDKTSTPELEFPELNTSCEVLDSSSRETFNVSCESRCNIFLRFTCIDSQTIFANSSQIFQCFFSDTSNLEPNDNKSSTIYFISCSDNLNDSFIKNTTAYIQPHEALSDSTIGIIVGVVLGSATIVSIVVVLAWRRKKQKSIKKRAVAPPKSYLCNDITKPSSNMTKDGKNKDGTSSWITNTKEDRTKERSVYSNVVSNGQDNLSFEQELDNEDGLTYELPDLLKQENKSSKVITSLNNNISGDGVETIDSNSRSTSKLQNSSENYGRIISGFNHDKLYEDIPSDISASASVTPDPRNRATFPLSNSKTTLNIDQHIYLNALLLEQGLSQTQLQSPASMASAVSTSDVDPVASNDDSKTDSVYFELEREDCSDEEASDEEQEPHCEDHDYESYSHV
ncbi:uncharacterized protein LOC106072493 isoform X2 [Biomphalaria glabrata]|uniref:Uncharacterized protein LOC106072493 isoform X2 n=1 Tax=Biomphalaria glabrata TaxID=6526 RepID=A0A9W2YC46_BIOGL|nr:uncharacterized protein LOC106072493 isoform X2 [Biomphalaria glabrata]